MTPLTVELVVLDKRWNGLVVSGDLDLSNIAQLEEELNHVMEKDVNLLIDLTSTSFMDSTSLTILITAQSEMLASGRSFALVVNDGPVSRLIELTGMSSELNIIEDPQQVLGQ